MVWCGVVWCGVVWCGVVWCGVVWCGVVWCGVVWCGVVWCGVVWCGFEDFFFVIVININNVANTYIIINFFILVFFLLFLFLLILFKLSLFLFLLLSLFYFHHGHPRQLASSDPSIQSALLSHLRELVTHVLLRLHLNWPGRHFTGRFSKSF